MSSESNGFDIERCRADGGEVVGRNSGRHGRAMADPDIRGNIPVLFEGKNEYELVNIYYLTNLPTQAEGVRRGAERVKLERDRRERSHGKLKDLMFKKLREVRAERDAIRKQLVAVHEENERLREQRPEVLRVKGEPVRVYVWDRHEEELETRGRTELRAWLTDASSLQQPYYLLPADAADEGEQRVTPDDTCDRCPFDVNDIEAMQREFDSIDRELPDGFRPGDSRPVRIAFLRREWERLKDEQGSDRQGCGEGLSELIESARSAVCWWREDCVSSTWPGQGPEMDRLAAAVDRYDDTPTPTGCGECERFKKAADGWQQAAFEWKDDALNAHRQTMNVVAERDAAIKARDAARREVEEERKRREQTEAVGDEIAGERDHWRTRAERAEQEVERLREGLQGLQDLFGGLPGPDGSGHVHYARANAVKTAERTLDDLLTTTPPSPEPGHRYVRKVKGDTQFEGWVLQCEQCGHDRIKTLEGEPRILVEDDRKIVMHYRPDQFEAADGPTDEWDAERLWRESSIYVVPCVMDGLWVAKKPGPPWHTEIIARCSTHAEAHAAAVERAEKGGE